MNIPIDIRILETTISIIKNGIKIKNPILLITKDYLNQDEDILLLPKTISYLIERDIQIISIYNKIRRIKESKVMNKILLLSGPNKKMVMIKK